MESHQDIDRRSLHLAQEIASRIDKDPALLGRVRTWADNQRSPAVLEWREILRRSWPEVRAVLLESGNEGQRLRQSSPFVGILTPQERWRIYRDTSRA